MKSRFRRAARSPTLMLTSLLDMFTIILIFLIVSFEAEAHEFKLNPQIKLPESSAEAKLKPAVNLVISRQGVIVSDRLVVPFEQGSPLPKDLSDGQIPTLVEALETEYKNRFGESAADAQEAEERGVIVVQSDKQLDYKTLYLVLKSAAQAGFFKYRLAILKS